MRPLSTTIYQLNGVAVNGGTEQTAEEDAVAKATAGEWESALVHERQ